MPWVVKLSGSLYDAPQLKPWLSALAQCCRGRAVIVPGGGPFADQVRSAQRRWSFDDPTAHRMAMRGMEQFGLMMAALEPRLIPARDPSEIREALQARRLPVWMPAGMMDADRSLPADWSVSSDTLAWWLAVQLRAEALLLVKSVTLSAGVYTADELRARQVVDEAFGKLQADSHPTVWIAGRNESSELQEDGAWPLWKVRVQLSGHGAPQAVVAG